MTGRVLVTARCRRRGHVLGQLLAVTGTREVVIPHYAVGTAKGSQIVNQRGPEVAEPLDRSMTYNAMCSCGVHAVHAAVLDDAAATGVTVITLDPILL